jgi:AcrR family transcriptional regulator
MATTRRLTARGRERREELLAYATRRFAENGFHPTSVADIVDGVGVGKGVFYWYFPSKEDLLREILREALLDLRRTQQAALEPATDPLQRIELGIQASLTWSEANTDILRLVMFARTEESFAHALARGRHIGNADTARHVQDAIDAGQIAPGDPTMLAVAIRGITEELSREYLEGPAVPDPNVCDTAVRMCIHGLLGHPRPNPATG